MSISFHQPGKCWNKENLPQDINSPKIIFWGAVTMTWPDIWIAHVTLKNTNRAWCGGHLRLRQSHPSKPFPQVASCQGAILEAPRWFCQNSSTWHYGLLIGIKTVPKFQNTPWICLRTFCNSTLRNSPRKMMSSPGFPRKFVWVLRPFLRLITIFTTQCNCFRGIAWTTSVEVTLLAASMRILSRKLSFK